MNLKIGRNQKCPCGSDKKYKYCCGQSNDLPKGPVKNTAPAAQKHNKKNKTLLSHDLTIYHLFANPSANFIAQQFSRGELESAEEELYDLAEGLEVQCFIDDSGILSFILNEDTHDYDYYFDRYHNSFISGVGINVSGVLLMPAKGSPVAAMWLLSTLIGGGELSWTPYPKEYWQTLRQTLFALYRQDSDDVKFEGVIFNVDIEGTPFGNLPSPWKADKKSQQIATKVLKYCEFNEGHPFAIGEQFKNFQYKYLTRYNYRDPNNQRLFEKISFAFSDGVAINPRDVLSHPYSMLLVNNVFSTAQPTSHFKITQHYNPFGYLEKSKNWHESRDDNELLGRIFSQVNAGKFKLFLNCKEKQKGKKQLLEAKSCVWSHDIGVQRWQLQTKQGELEFLGTLKIDEQKYMPINEALFYNEQDKEMVLNSLDAEHSTLNYHLSQRSHYKDYSLQLKNISATQREVRVKTTTYVDDVLTEIEPALMKNHQRALKYPEIKTLSSDQIQLEFYGSFNDEDRLDMGLKIQEENESLRVLGLPKYFYNLLNGMNSGLASALGEDQKELAVRRRGPERQNDLKILRHGGFFCLLLSEVLKERINRAGKGPITSEKEWKAEVTKKINLLAGSLFLDKTATAEEVHKSQLSDFCSKKVTSKITSWLSEMLKDKIYGEYRVLMPSGQIVQFDWRFYLDQILLLLCQAFLKGFGTKAFLCAKKKDHLFAVNYRSEMRIVTGEDFVGNTEQPEASAQLYLPRLRNHIMESLPEAAQLFFDGKALEDIDEKDLQVSMQLQEHQDLDWFDMDPKVFFKGEPISKTEVDKFLGKPIVFYKGCYYRIKKREVPSLKWLDYFWSRLQSSGKGRSKFGEEGSIEHQNKSEVLNMLALRQAGMPVIGGARWQRICRQYDELDTGSLSERLSQQPWLRDIQVPLKDYQKQGVQWLLDHYGMELGGILADDMGLGKTVQFLTFLKVLKQRQELGVSLAVVPTSLMYNWQSEILKFVPDLAFTFFDPKAKADLSKLWADSSPQKLVITTYGLLNEHADFFEDKLWNVVVFDEGQYLKNIKSLRTKSARRLKATCKFVLSGTPMENHYGEFYSLIDLVVPGALGQHDEFMKVYGFKKSQGVIESLNAQDIEFLRLKTQSLVLRRTKSSILKELPEKTESLLTIPFENVQKKIYRDTAISWNKKVLESIEQKGEAKSQLEMLTALLRLRQICSSPGIVPGVDYKKLAPKMALLLEKVEELVEKKESVLIFANFLKTIEIVEKELQVRGISCLKLTGDMHRKDRVRVLEEFDNHPEKQVLLMTLKVGGVGLNLTKASYVFHLEPWWNPAVEDQATDRTHRLGQTQKVNVYRYIMEASVEEKIQTLKGIKKQAFEMLFAESEEAAASSVNFNKTQLSKKDFEALLSVNSSSWQA